MTPFNDLNLLVGELFGYLTQVFNLYTTNWLLQGVFTLWVIRRVMRLFNRL